jgi:hypothetical protein
VFCKSCFGQTWWKGVSPKQGSCCFGQTKTVTFLHPLKMADSVPLDTALDLVPILGVRLKNTPAVLSDDVRLKLAEHIYSDMDVRDMEVLLILMLFSIFYFTAGKLKRFRNL